MRLSVLKFVLVATSVMTVSAASISLLGQQDYPDGAFVYSNSEWLIAQSGEGAPFDIIHVAPTNIVFTHTRLDSGRDGILTFSLGDIDSDQPGNQVPSFLFDGVPQPIGIFESLGKP